MTRVVRKEKLAENIHLIEVEAPLIARAAQPGQFVVLRLNEQGERVPLTIADKHPEKGTIEIIFQEAGATTKLLSGFKAGDDILNLLGPLGTPAHIEKVGTVLVIGGGVGIAETYPAITAYRKAGNRVVTIIGARCKELLITESKLRQSSDEFHIITDDGTCGRKGFVTDILKELIESEKQIDLVYAVGPVPMMEAVSKLTYPHGIKTVVSLNPLMLDATGMCGVCRVTVGGKTLFACVDGPEFNAHLVDFTELKLRLSTFKDKEKEALDHVCRLSK